METSYEMYGEEFAFCGNCLTNGEYILWKGKPARRRLFTSTDVFLIPFSIVWCGFAVVWTLAALNSGVVFALFGVPFVLVGLYLLVGRFIHAAYLFKNTAYVITNKKIIRRRGRKIDMLNGKSLPPMYVDMFEDGTGTIRFGEPVMYYRGRTRAVHPSQMFSLENIEDVANVEQIISNIER